MEKINIYIETEKDLVETYNHKVISSSLIEYMLESVKHLKKNEECEVVLHVSKTTQGCSSMIQKRLEEEYKNNIKNHNIMNIKQVILLVLGLCMLLVSSLFRNFEVLYEVALIGAWVPIWEAIELEILTDTSEKRRRQQLKKLMQAEISETLMK